jgi:hypothetical protein
MTSITQTHDPHTGEPMEPISDKTPVSLALVGLVVGWIVAAMMAYSAFDSRVAVIENQMQQFRSDVAEMKGDVKQLLRNTQ